MEYCAPKDVLSAFGLTSNITIGRYDSLAAGRAESLASIKNGLGFAT